MIYVNDKLVDFKNRKPDYEFADIVNDYHKTIAELRGKHKEYVTFVTRRSLRIDPETKQIRQPKSYSWPNKIKMISNDGPQEWIYSSSIASIKEGKIITTDPYFQVVSGSIAFSIDESPDFIFFLTKHRCVKSGRLSIYDPEATHRERAEKMRMESRFKDLIYSENSPLAENLEMLHTIARKWGVAGVNDMSEAAVRNSLFDVVNEGERSKAKGVGNNGIEEFLNDFNLDDGVKIGSLVQQAIDKEILYFNRETNEWLLVIEKDQMPLSIMMVASHDASRSRQRLVDYLLKNRHDVTVIEKAISGGVSIKYGAVVDKNETVKRLATLENIDSLGYNDLQSSAAELGIGSAARGAKKDVLYKLVKNKLEELVTT